jgi:photosystem II stability/assembly factor-like uncharacterized protein
MPCLTQPNLTVQQQQGRRAAVTKLLESVAAGTVKVVVGPRGSVAFSGWKDEDRNGVSDLCAFRALMNAPEMRRAVFRAEALSGNRMNPMAVASGLHSHDGGQTWGRH